VLIAIANHAHPDGTGAWAKVATLAHESRLSEREVQYAQVELKKIGELGVENGAGPYGTNLYHMPKMMAFLGANPAPVAHEGCTQVPLGVHTGSPEPLKPEPIKPKRARACSWPEGFALTEEMFAYAIERGVPQPEAEFAAFRDWCLRQGAVYKDWPAAWRTRVYNYTRFNGGSNGTRSAVTGGVTRAEQRLTEAQRQSERVLGRSSGLVGSLRADLPRRPDSGTSCFLPGNSEAITFSPGSPARSAVNRGTAIARVPAKAGAGVRDSRDVDGKATLEQPAKVS
jgi:hypothetical protein